MIRHFQHFKTEDKVSSGLLSNALYRKNQNLWTKPYVSSFFKRFRRNVPDSQIHHSPSCGISFYQNHRNHPRNHRNHHQNHRNLDMRVYITINICEFLSRCLLLFHLLLLNVKLICFYAFLCIFLSHIL